MNFRSAQNAIKSLVVLCSEMICAKIVTEITIRGWASQHDDWSWHGPT